MYQNSELDVLIESLREKCVYQIVANQDDTQVYKKWYNYMTFMQLEIMKDQQITIANSERALSHIGISPEEVNDCVENSFVEPGNYQSENRILKEDRKWQEIMRITSHPTISINNHTYRGNFVGKDIAVALCASFKDRPDECKDGSLASRIGSDQEYDDFD